ncbi:uncharacterized protein N7458_005974 [Penicillium daleae]|uniref:Uncharacterized protein n=1 Tax=Penicillium daleae TaxID=63821 RepID=A0AAD6C5N7_9EURO|nr:uncharacterized protein N7458_005974 [Penicillium daleae]KAJ5449525.1 hypothetical protein N7458_005974 [Penicillium daleae]
MDNGQNTSRIKRCMKIQGCWRLMQNNHLPVILPKANWNTRVRLRSRDGINFWLDVDPDYQLRAQDHESLIRAALGKLSIHNQWWIADVYVVEEDDDHDTNPDTVKRFFRSLNERFPNDRRPPDGLIYERIRYYEGYLDGPIDEWAAKDWWAMLETTPGSKKGKYLRAFLKHPQFPQKLDSLLVIPGLWGGMRIGLLHKLLTMHCDEVRHCLEMPKLSLMLYVAANPMLLELDFEDLSENRGGPSRAPASDGWSNDEIASISRT